MTENKISKRFLYAHESLHLLSHKNRQSDTPSLGQYQHAHSSTQYSELNRTPSLLSSIPGQVRGVYQIVEEKKQIISDIKHLITDLTGVETMTSDWGNTLLSISNGNWTNTAISYVSIDPFLHDIARSGKLYHYYLTIRQAAYLAREDGIWANSLRLVFTPLKKYIDQLYDLSENNLAEDLVDEISHIKYEVDSFLPSSLVGGVAPGYKVSEAGRKKYRQNEASLGPRASNNAASSPVQASTADPNKTACLMNAANDGSPFVKGAQ